AAGLQLYHIDLYRLSSAREVEALGIRDLLDARAVLLIEWPSRGAGALPTEDLSVSIEYQGSAVQRRLLRAQAGSSAGDKLLEHILAATSE
ncbi:MAG: tRNA (adenosine(37)-N6)-threonylcarbamoyltransferase complex ATPase subunit type 1 TsaE, partial [Steroidobacteraceae bacterium]